MTWIEKHGGLWLDDPSDVRTQPLFERFDPSTGLLAVVVRSPMGHFIGSLRGKVNDPQWWLPLWNERQPHAIFDNLDEAIAYSLTLVG